MSTSRSVAFLVLVAIVGLTVAPIASGAVVGTLTGDSNDEGESSDEIESTMDVSTFMQSTATDTERSVESGMHDSRYNAADNESRADLVLERTDELEDRLETLEAERDELRESKADDDLHPGEYRARMTRLTVEIQSLERSIDRTEQRANETDVDDERLDDLRENAASLSGPEVAEIARGLGGPDGTPGGGPPDHAGPSNQTDDGDRGQGNANPPGQAGSGNQTDNGNSGQGNANPPGQADPGNQTDDGDRGQGNDSPPGQAGSGNQTDDDGAERGNANPPDHANAGNQTDDSEDDSSST
ncbi:hypothetical protein [Natronorubrum sp. FCH18a]|uniref:hypothetical protein n=1 Tax=Natronorubrum sp. FCH18a TaxID=3447018 RepID=UPI003F51A628